jgi:hypothetical protein
MWHHRLGDLNLHIGSRRTAVTARTPYSIIEDAYRGAGF